MKTENLTWVEAIKAYANGERIRSLHGREYWIDIDRPMKEWQDGIIEHFQGPRYESGYWSIVVPEVKSLTFEEAITKSCVRIDGPHPMTFKKPYFSEHFSAFDLADRKGWKMVEVKSE